MTALDALAERLATHADVRRNEPMARHTTFGIGGPADVFVTVEGAGAAVAVVRETAQAGVTPFVLGSGSNIVVADAGIRGVVVDNRARGETQPGTGSLRVESGASFAGLARRTCRQGQAGLAWAAGIPGTLGGAVVYNAGAYGGCLADVLVRARLFDAADDREAWVEAADLGLAYRSSSLTREGLKGRVILEVELRLQPGEAPALLAEVAEYDRRRLAAQPRGRNAGSMFKNPVDQPAWKLIDAVGLRGARRGDAAISEKHCNFFVNLGQARGADVAWLADEAERRVHDRFGVRLEREVGFVGEWS